VVPTIRPSVVLATGDLTDAKTADNMGSAQQLKEWQIYRKILSDTRVTNKTVWLDIRGNHGERCETMLPKSMLSAMELVAC